MEIQWSGGSVRCVKLVQKCGFTIRVYGHSLWSSMMTGWVVSSSVATDKRSNFLKDFPCLIFRILSACLLPPHSIAFCGTYHIFCLQHQNRYYHHFSAFLSELVFQHCWIHICKICTNIWRRFLVCLDVTSFNLVEVYCSNRGLTPFNAS